MHVCKRWVVFEKGNPTLRFYLSLCVILCMTETTPICSRILKK